MRILILTPDVTPRNVKRNYNTGFSLMVNQIACALSYRGEDVFLSSSSFFNPAFGKDKEGYILLSRSIWAIVRHSRIKDWLKALRYFFTPQPLRFSDRYKMSKYIVSTGFNEHLIKTVRPDVVSIHSILPAVFPFIWAALRCNVPFAVSLHGVFSFLNENFETSLERNILKFLISRGTEVTFVSSGTCRRLAECYGFHSENMNVVTNALPSSGNEEQVSGEEIEGGCILSVGNLCERKNQIQTLRAYSMLPEKIRKRHRLCFIGKDGMNGSLQKEAERLGLSGYVIFTGVLSRPHVYAWLEKASLVVLASKDEGFGLSLIEGFRFGVPVICFSDIDAYEDIKSPDAVIGTDVRTDKSLSEAMSYALESHWDKEAIIAHSLKFSDERMAEAYCNVFGKALSPGIAAEEFEELMDRYVLQSYGFSPSSFSSSEECS